MRFCNNHAVSSLYGILRCAKYAMLGPRVSIPFPSDWPRTFLEQAKVGRGGPNRFVQRHLRCFAQVVLQTACHPGTWRAIPQFHDSASDLTGGFCRGLTRLKPGQELIEAA